MIKILENYRFEFRRAKSSHQIYLRSEDNKMIVVLYHGRKDMKMGTFLAILKQAEIDKMIYKI